MTKLTEWANCDKNQYACKAVKFTSIAAAVSAAGWYAWKWWKLSSAKKQSKAEVSNTDDEKVIQATSKDLEML